MKKEFDEIEQLFRDTLLNNEIVPPTHNKEIIYTNISFSGGASSVGKGFNFFNLLSVIGALLFTVTQSFNTPILEKKATKELTAKTENNRVDEFQIQNETTEESSVENSVTFNESKVDNSKTNQSLIDFHEKEQMRNTTNFSSTKENSTSRNTLKTFNNTSSKKKFDKKEGTPEIVHSQEQVLPKTEQKNRTKTPQYSSVIENASLNNTALNSDNPTENKVLHQKNEANNLPLLSLPLKSIEQEKPTILQPKLASSKNKRNFPFYLSLYVGYNLNDNRLKEVITNTEYLFRISKIKESNGFHLSLENEFKLSKRFGFSAGFGWDRSTISYSDEGLEAIFIDTTFSTINYFNTQNTLSENNFSIPISVNYHLPIGNCFEIKTSVGLNLSLQKNSSINSADNSRIVTNKFGYKTFVRPEFIYHFPGVSFGVYGKYLYDFKPNSTLIDLKREHQVLQFGFILKKTLFL